jgi:hypothetical protein
MNRIVDVQAVVTLVCAVMLPLLKLIAALRSAETRRRGLTVLTNGGRCPFVYGLPIFDYSLLYHRAPANIHLT